jgi:hypothetical protein
MNETTELAQKILDKKIKNTVSNSQCNKKQNETVHRRTDK